MLVYNALTMPLVISFLSVALLWRNQRERARAAASEPDVAVPARSGRPRPVGGRR
jgi:hypothetical protein